MQVDFLYYQTEEGRKPFSDWLYSERMENKTRNIILERLHRLNIGNTGHWRSIGKGVFELKIDYGPGYRIYYGNAGKKIILLLCGGNKSTQKKDIKLALKYWTDFKDRLGTKSI